MRLTLDPDDLKPLEDTLTRALVRAFRTIARDAPGILGALAADPPPPPAPAPPEAPAPVFGALIDRPPPPEAPRPPPGPATATVPPPAANPPPPAASGRKRHLLRDQLRCVADRPEGYQTSSDAHDWLRAQGARDPEMVLLRWIRDGSVAAVIATDTALPPTKGLPGRLMVLRSDVRERNKLRLERMPGRWRVAHTAPGGLNDHRHPA